MKTKHCLFQGVIFVTVLLVGMGMADVALAEGMKPFEASVDGLDGQARYSTDGMNWKALKWNYTIKEGNFVQTKTDSPLNLLFRSVAPGAMSSDSWDARVSGKEIKFFGCIRLFPESTVRVVSLKRKQRWSWKHVAMSIVRQDVCLDLTAGRIMVDFPTTPTPGMNEITFQGGKAWSSGGVYMLSFDGNSYVLKGSIQTAVTGSDVVQTIPAGFTRNSKGKISPISPSIMEALKQHCLFDHCSP